MKVLVLGGVRSGKSRYAQVYALQHAGELGAVTVIATATGLDAEMRARIATHRATRPEHWSVIEEPMRLAATLRATAHSQSCIVVDCLTLWLTNLLCSEDAAALERERGELLDLLPSLQGHCVLVANETGLGIVPDNVLARRFTDVAGELHQQLAAQSDCVVLMVAGLPWVVKPGGA